MIWTQDEINLLYDVYPTHTYREMASLFPQYTRQQIVKKASLIGLRKTQETMRRINAEVISNRRINR